MKISDKMREVVTKAALAARFDSKMETALDAIKVAVVDYLDGIGRIRASEIPSKFVPFVEVRGHTEVWCRTSRDGEPRSVSVILPHQYCGRIENFGDSMHPWENESALKMGKIIDEKVEFKKDVKAVLAACTTDKHLHDTAPELFKFIPEPTAVCTALVSVETVNRVRAALNNTGE